MNKEQKAKLEQIEAEGRRKINEAIFGNLLPTPKEMIYKYVGIVLIVLGFFAGFALRYLVGPSPIIGISFAVCLVSGMVVMRLGDRIRAKRIKSLPPTV